MITFKFLNHLTSFSLIIICSSSEVFEVSSVLTPDVSYDNNLYYLRHKEMYRKTCDDDERRSRQFLFEYQLFNSGCTLKCILLTSSSRKYENYFNRSNMTEHYFHNIPCGPSQVCSYGACLRDPRVTTSTTTQAPKPTNYGRVLVFIQRGYSKHMDTTSKGDLYIIAYHRNKIIHTTKSIKDDHYPVFNEEFHISNIGLNESIKFVVMDDDRLVDDKLGEFWVTPHEILSTGNNGKIREYSFNPSDGYISLSITWSNDPFG